MQTDNQLPPASSVADGCYVDHALVEREAIVAFLKREADRCYEEGKGDSSLANQIIAEGDALLVAATQIAAGKHVADRLSA